MGFLWLPCFPGLQRAICQCGFAVPMQVAGKAGCMVENTPHGVSWKMTALLVILTFRARQQNPFRNYLSLRTGWLHLLKTHVFPAALGEQSLDKYLLESDSQISFPLGHSSWRPTSLKPWHQPFMGMSLLGTSRDWETGAEGLFLTWLLPGREAGFGAWLHTSLRILQSPHNGIFWSCRISNEKLTL